MGKIIAVVNQKGGVGKTTTAINLSACLAAEGKKVLAVDADQQGNTTSGLGLDKNGIPDTIYNVFLGEKTISDVKQPTCVEGLEVVPANINLTGAEIELIGNDRREYILRESLEEIKDDYDFIIIDCPPSLNMITVNALVAADTVLVPIQCEYFALEGLTQLLSTIRLVQRLWNPGLSIEGVLLTMFDVRTKLSVEVQQEVRKYFKEKVYRCYIPRNVRLSEAPSRGESIFEYDTRSEGAKAYVGLVKEVISQNEKR